MTKPDTYPKPEYYGDAQVPAFGYELLRNFLLPELLGEETATILYWSGRKIARHYPAESIDQIVLFFSQAGWGNLELVEKTKSKMVFHCQSEIIQSRIVDNPRTAVFTMESGFLAEQVQRLVGCAAECYVDIKTGRHKRIEFAARWDPKDPRTDV